MSNPLSAVAVCFIACHGGPADHFATFGAELANKGYHVEYHAAGPALDKLRQRKVERLYEFSPDSTSSKDLAQRCSRAAIVITDVGHQFDIPLQEALREEAPKSLRCAYYDNPEPFVPGGYSKVAAKVMGVAEKVLFANGNLVGATLYEEKGVEIPLNEEKRVGIGYYPKEQAERIAARRGGEQKLLRKDLFLKLGIEDAGQKVLVYTGGNNSEYFEKAFPAFLHFLKSARSNLSHYLILLQQHPGAKAANLDGKLLEKELPVFVSTLSSEDAQVVADGILYYQTSMGPQFALAGIPTLQVGHEVYEDLLVKNELCSTATSADQFEAALIGLGKKGVVVGGIERELGIHADWSERLENVVKGEKS